MSYKLYKHESFHVLESSHTTAEDGSEETNNETENNMSGSNDAGRETIYCETVK